MSCAHVLDICSSRYRPQAFMPYLVKRSFAPVCVFQTCCFQRERERSCKNLSSSSHDLMKSPAPQTNGRCFFAFTSVLRLTLTKLRDWLNTASIFSFRMVSEFFCLSFVLALGQNTHEALWELFVTSLDSE